MTLAFCIKCGRQKTGAWTACDRCGKQPIGEDELACGLVLSDQILGPEDIAEIRAHLAAGGPTPDVDRTGEAYEHALNIVRSNTKFFIKRGMMPPPAST